MSAFAEVVDQVSQQRHAAREGEDQRVRDRSRTQHPECPGDRADPLARSFDRRVDQAVRVAVARVLVMMVIVRVVGVVVRTTGVVVLVRGVVGVWP